ncbi:MAG: putative penicillin binding protein [Ramlibacter sp.]|jgi:CubicO group peptidase (beta-lactamase class C family)|nr:putative penicillin binding protein [Ramlibacter sp.]
MKIHRSRAAWALAAGVLAIGANAQPLPPVSPAAAGFSPAGLERLDRFFAREIEAKRVPGAVVAIARGGKLVHYKAYGMQDPAKGTPMKLDTVFGLASMTKPMAVVGALELTEDGRLPLKSRLADYFPGFGTMKVGVAQPEGALRMVDQARPIFIQDLMRHTSGLTYGGRGDHPIAKLYPGGTVPPSEGDIQAFIDRLTKLPLAHQPGTAFEYSFSIDVLGAVVEKVSGQRLDEYLQRTLWKPLRMNDTTFVLSDRIRPRIARPFANNPLDGKPQSIPPTEQQMKFDCAGACAMGTVGDYLRFGQMLVNGGELDGKRILSPQTVQQMTSNHLGPEIKNNVGVVEPHREGFGFGLGVAVRTSTGGSAVPGNPGEFTWNGAYGTAFFADPKEKLVVVVGTAAPGELRKYYREQVQDIVYGAMTR